MNVLIIAHHFPPENAMASLRPYSWAKYWSRAGHYVVVLTTQKASFDAPLTLNLPSSEQDNFQVEEVAYLRNASAQGISSNSDRKQSNKPAKSIKLLVKFAKKMRMLIGSGALLSIRSLWIQPALNRAIELHYKKPFEIIISTYGPPAPHIIAGRMKQKLPSLFWVADYRDLWNDYYFENRKWPLSVLERFFETYFVKRADLLSTVSKPLGEILSKRFHKAILTVENGFDLDDLKLRANTFFEFDQKVRLIYTGRLHSKNRDPKPLLRAIRKLKDKGVLTKKNFEALFFSNELGDLPVLIKQYGVPELVKTPGFVSRDVSLFIQHSASALIFLDWADPSISGILTGKLFEYLYAGTPILGIGSHEQSTAGQLIQESGCGICLGFNVDKIANVIQNMIEGKLPPYEPKPEVLQRYTRESLSMRMLNEILYAQSNQLNIENNR